MARPLLIAHRGASVEAPENTLTAFARALDRGVDGVEMDVRVTRDGRPVVFHDATLARLAGVRKRIAHLDLADLEGVRVGGEPVPTLEQVIDLVCSRAVAQIEIKDGVSVPPVIQAIRRTGKARRVILASFDPTILRATRQLAPRIPRMLISGQGQVASLARATAGLDVVGVSLDHRTVRSPAQVQSLHQRGWRVWCWTVNRPVVMLRLHAWGADALLSDNPALLVTTFS